MPPCCPDRRRPVEFPGTSTFPALDLRSATLSPPTSTSAPEEPTGEQVIGRRPWPLDLSRAPSNATSLPIGADVGSSSDREPRAATPHGQESDRSVRRQACLVTLRISGGDQRVGGSSTGVRHHRQHRLFAVIDEQVPDPRDDVSGRRAANATEKAPRPPPGRPPMHPPMYRRSADPACSPRGSAARQLPARRPRAADHSGPAVRSCVLDGRRGS